MAAQVNAQSDRICTLEPHATLYRATSPYLSDSIYVKVPTTRQDSSSNASLEAEFQLLKYVQIIAIEHCAMMMMLTNATLC